MKPKFYNKDGSLTRYALACGYIERRGSIHDESYVVLEQISSNGTLRVMGGGRWLRSGVYLGTSLTEARRAFRCFDHKAESEKARLAWCEANGIAA